MYYKTIHLEHRENFFLISSYAHFKYLPIEYLIIIVFYYNTIQWNLFHLKIEIFNLKCNIGIFEFIRKKFFF